MMNVSKQNHQGVGGRAASPPWDEVGSTLHSAISQCINCLVFIPCEHIEVSSWWYQDVTVREVASFYLLLSFLPAHVHT